MKAHFIGDLMGDKKAYERIVGFLENSGWVVITKHSLQRDIREVKSESPEESEAYAKLMRGWIKSSDVVVVEVTTPGLGAGYEVATAMELGRPVIALYKPMKNNTPYVLHALENQDKMQVISYTEDDLEEVLGMALDYATDNMDTRFNFFISPKHQNYLDWISRRRKVPRAVFLRSLIEEAMDTDEEYNA